MDDRDPLYAASAAAGGSNCYRRYGAAAPGRGFVVSQAAAKLDQKHYAAGLLYSLAVTALKMAAVFAILLPFIVRGMDSVGQLPHRYLQ